MPNNTESLGDVVAGRIKDQVFREGRYAPGDQLPVEAALAEEMGVSRTALREAIKILEFQGIVEIRRGVGTFVATNFGLGGTGDDSSEAAQRAILREWYEARLSWDVEAARAAAARGTDEELERIASIQESIREATKADGDFLELDHAFHKAIVEASHNRIMQRVVYESGLMDWSYFLVARQREQLRARMERNASLSHDMIVGFLLDRDPEGAALAARHHLMQAIRDLDLSAGA